MREPANIDAIIDLMDIDISNANTIIVSDAHHFGLSDLHQMRGTFHHESDFRNSQQGGSSQSDRFWFQERKQRTRRLIQEGAILESVYPQCTELELETLKSELKRKFASSP